MRLPELTQSGDLPLGVHRASLRETLDRFGIGHPQRIAVGERLERIYHVAAATGHLARFIVGLFHRLRVVRDGQARTQ
jgi:hypothetical protein